MTGPVLLDDPHDARVARSATGVLAAFNAAGVLEPADVHVATRIARLGGESADDVLLALALAVRGVRLGSVCVDLAAVRGTVLGAGDEPVDVSGAAVARPRRRGLAACAASPLVADGPDAPGRAAAAARRRPALPRAVLAAGGAGPHRAGRPRRTPRRPGRPRPAACRAGPAVRRRPATRGRTGSGSRRPSPRSARSPCSPAARAPARPPPWPRSSRCCATAPARPPRIALAAPTGKAAARLQEAVRRRRASATVPTASHPAPAARLAAGRAAGSATTATTGCPTTWSSSTRRRWCR